MLPLPNPSPQPQKTALPQSKGDFYRDLSLQLKGLLEGERDWVANAANLSALLYLMVPDLNWAGIYVLRRCNGKRDGKRDGTRDGKRGSTELVLGPFQGKPACVRIPVTPVAQGVCGAAASKIHTMIVDDVHEFPGHIACDSASQSELVVPLIRNGVLWGVVDLDSPSHSRFDAEDAAGVEALAATFLCMTEFPG